MSQKRNSFSPTHKAKLACLALTETKTINELASESGIHPSQIVQWKKKLVDESYIIFEPKRGKSAATKKQNNVDVAELQRLVGEQAIMLAWYKKKFGLAN